MRQTVLLTLQDIPYFCYPESVGLYVDHPEHTVLREAGALNNFNIHYVAAGKGYVEVDGVVHELRAGQAVLYFRSSGSITTVVRMIHGMCDGFIFTVNVCMII